MKLYQYKKPGALKLGFLSGYPILSLALFTLSTSTLDLLSLALASAHRTLTHPVRKLEVKLIVPYKGTTINLTIKLVLNFTILLSVGTL